MASQRFVFVAGVCIGVITTLMSLVLTGSLTDDSHVVHGGSGAGDGGAVAADANRLHAATTTAVNSQPPPEQTRVVYVCPTSEDAKRGVQSSASIAGSSVNGAAAGATTAQTQTPTTTATLATTTTTTATTSTTSTTEATTSATTPAPTTPAPTATPCPTLPPPPPSGYPHWVNHASCPHRGPTAGPAHGLPDPDFAPCACDQSQLPRTCSAPQPNNWRDDMWRHTLEGMQPPPLEKKTWRQPYCGQKLAVVYPEHGLKHSLRGTLNNLAHVYGGSDVSLYIFHSQQNRDELKKITADWTNVQYHEAMNNLRVVGDYSIFLGSWAFYNVFPQQFIVVTQSDVLVTKRIPEHYFRYGYVGAPWPHWGEAVGNGGFSLRRVETMKRVMASFGENSRADPEDLWFSFRLNHWEVPEPSCAQAFATEAIWCDSTVALHQIHVFAPDPCKFYSIARRLPGFGDVTGMQQRWKIASSDIPGQK